MKSVTIYWSMPALVLAIVLIGLPAAAEGADFEDLVLAPNGHFVGIDNDSAAGSGTASTFTSGGLTFSHYWDEQWNYWDGWAYSNIADMTTAGYLNQHSAYVAPDPGPGKVGVGGSPNYAVAYNSARGIATIEIPPEQEITGAWITNTTYAYLAIKDGNDGVPPEWGGPYVRPFTTDDWFKLEIFGVDATGQDVGAVEFLLADYTGFVEGTSDPDDFIVTDWSYVDLSNLQGSRRLEFALSSSDTDPDPDIGMNTPAFFAVDNVTTVPEPATIAMIVSAALCGMLWWWRRR